MLALTSEGNVKARCPDCGGAVTTFEHKTAQTHHGMITRERKHAYNGGQYKRTLYVLLRCAGCGRGGLATIHDNGSIHAGVLEAFYPTSIDLAELPVGVPEGVLNEYREAELCASTGAFRAATGLLRSTLEKLLKANGYKKGNLENKIDLAAKDGVITESRRKRAHDEVRVLGNDIFHDEWRPIDQEDFRLSHHYVQRLIEDFYDERGSVEEVLIAKDRIQEPTAEPPTSDAS